MRVEISRVSQPAVRARMLSGFAKSQPFRDLGQVRQFASLLAAQLPAGANGSELGAGQLSRTVGHLLDTVAEFAGKGLLAGSDAPESEAESRSLAAAASSVLAGLDDIGRGLQFARPGFGAAASGIAVSVQRLRPDGTQLVQSADRSSTVKLRLLPDSAQGTAVSMVTTVLNLPHLTRRLGTAKQPVVSNVIQATLYSGGERLDAASSGQPAAEVLLLIPHSRISGQLRQCVHLLPPPSQAAAAASSPPEFLSPSGCRVAVELSSPTVTACLCRHLSSFAVTVLPGTAWLGVETHRLWRLHSEPLRILTWICLTVSIVCLLLTSITYIVVRMQTPMADKSIATLHRVHRSLCLALMLGQALFLAAFQPLDATPIAACKLLSVLTLYALLCAFCWLLCEGLMYTHSLVIVLPRVDSAFAKVKFWHYCLASGVAPLLIVLPTAALRPEQLIQTEADASADSGGLLRPSVCWLSGDHGVSFAFIGPAMAVCLVNLCLFAVIMRRLAGTRSDAADAVGGSAATSASLRLSYLSRQMKVTATLACLLGLTWLLGLMFLFAETHLFIVAQYLFTLLNGLQGCFIFATQVCAHKRVREDWEKFLIDGRRTPGSLRRLLEQRRNARLSAPGSGSTPANKAQQGRLRQPLLPPQGQQQQQLYLPYEGDARYLVDKSSQSDSGLPSQLSRLLSVFRRKQQPQRQHRRDCQQQLRLHQQQPPQQPSDTVTDLSNLSPPRLTGDCGCPVVVNVNNNNRGSSSTSGVGSGSSAWASRGSRGTEAPSQAPLVTEENFTSCCDPTAAAAIDRPDCRGQDRRQQSSRRPQQLESGFFDSRAFGDTRLDDQSLFDITHSQAEPALRSPKSPLPEPPPIDTLPARCPGSRELLYNVTDTQASSEYLVPDCKPTEQLTKV
ncbi:hypothetical protein BOX15_Mlig024433g1 [Macrostomum lignano]|uniref:G-protein coupled receptors family 2 profile 2 domain-containing protein n=2 Tax=Macrostomum lignano TaxID=282301 RepID=A0A267GM53_9PLAT|nr:hypothetical protein BOX15_Mlig024433g1 [Macrostomum lignano]